MVAGTSDFFWFASSGLAHVLDQATYAADGATADGYPSGILPSLKLNKALRQGTMGSYVLGEFIRQSLQINIVDDGDGIGRVVQFWESVLKAGYFVDTGSASALLIAAPPGYTFPAPIAGLRITVRAASAPNGASVLNWMGTGNKPVVFTDGSATKTNDWPAASLLDLIFDGTSWQLFSSVISLFRVKLNAPLTLYVDAALGTDDSTHGLSAAAGAFRTRQFAWNYLVNRFDQNGQVVTINCNGAFTDNFLSLTSPIGYAGPASVLWNFSSGSTVAAGAFNAFSAFNGGVIGTIEGTAPTNLVITGQSGVNIINAGGVTYIGPNVTFGTCAGGDISATGVGGVALNNPITKSGSGSAFFLGGFYGGEIRWPNSGPITVTLAGSPTFSVATVNMKGAGARIIIPSGNAWSGATGGGVQRYAIDSPCTLDTNGAGATFIPGTIAGAATNGAIYE